MYFVIRDNKYLDCSGKSFFDFLRGKLDILPGESPSIADWENHLSTIFTEVRLKKIIEVRGADAGTWRRTCALPALWVGLLYGKDSLEAAEKISKRWKFKDIEKLSSDVAVKGLNAVIQKEKVIDIAIELLSIAKKCLIERKVLDSAGNNETGYLDILEETIQKKASPARELIKNFSPKHGNSFRKLIEDIAY